MSRGAGEIGSYEFTRFPGGKETASVENLKPLLDRVQADIAEVKRQYDFFFQGSRRTEPVSERRALEEALRKIGQRRFTNSSDQFRFNALQSRFHALLNLWSRMTRELEEGRLVRDARGAVARREPAAAPADPAPEKKPADPDHIERVVAQFQAARGACGIPAGDGDAATVRKTLEARARELAGRAGDKRVEFRVTIEGGKPKIKAVLR
jgi:hypothetical protein